MGKELGRYDCEIQMFVQPPKDPDMNHLRFLRRLAENGKFGPKPISVPRGDNVFRLSNEEIVKFALQQGDTELKPEQRMRQQQVGDLDRDSMYRKPTSDFEQTQ